MLFLLDSTHCLSDVFRKMPENCFCLLFFFFVVNWWEGTGYTRSLSVSTL